MYGVMGYIRYKIKDRCDLLGHWTAMSVVGARTHCHGCVFYVYEIQTY